ncbi:uncharacterized protein METZ01_LOCUS302039, partial [marine metagenome]
SITRKPVNCRQAKKWKLRFTPH